MPLLETRGAASARGLGLLSSAATPVYIEDVFSTWLYTGNGSSQTITNGIDLSGKGGMVWTAVRNNSGWNQCLFDTNRGVNAALVSWNSLAEQSLSLSLVGFNSDGYSLGSNNNVAFSSNTFVNWTFRKAPKFFDVVTWTGNGVAGRQIAHNLGSTPGCIIVKSTSVGNWQVWHRAVSAGSGLFLNDTAAAFSASQFTVLNGSTSTYINVDSDAQLNSNGSGYVAYILAHNAGGFGLSGTDNVISCGSFTATGNDTISLGYEPQFLLLKNASNSGDWFIVDAMRSLSQTSAANGILYPNSSIAETLGSSLKATATGFTSETWGAGTIIYIAIRRGPMRVPTDGTKVYDATAYTGNATVDTTVAGSAAFPVDMVLLSDRDATSQQWTTLYAHYVSDRLIGRRYTLSTAFTASQAEDWSNYHSYSAASSLGNWGLFGVNSGTDYFNKSGTKYIARKFRRAPGFFDEVCYTGTGGTSDRNVTHGLGVKPELIIVKSRSASGNWQVGSPAGNLTLNSTQSTSGAPYLQGWVSQPDGTATTFRLVYASGYSDVNDSGTTYTALLFATCPGVSKVGSYTGTGATLQINCGFTGGARFILIKRTDSTGDWYVWDTARGIVAGNDPYLLLNSNAAEVTTTDWVDTLSTGFELSNAGGNNVNINGASYVYLAIA